MENEIIKLINDAVENFLKIIVKVWNTQKTTLISSNAITRFHINQFKMSFSQYLPLSPTQNMKISWDEHKYNRRSNKSLVAFAI